MCQNSTIYFDNDKERHLLIQAPPSEVQDKIYFIMNNVSAANVESKGKEFSEILSIQYYPWFAQYMVIKRYMLSCYMYASDDRSFSLFLLFFSACVKFVTE